MSLASPYQEHYYVADGVTTSFSFGEYFTGLSQAYVKCIIYFDDGTNCVPTFTVDMTTGFITIVALTKPDGTVLTVPPAGSIVRVFRDTPEQQNVTASQLQNYTAKQLERIFDSVVAMIQEVSYSDLHKTIRLTETQRDIAIDYLPNDKDQAVIYWDVESRKLMPADFGQNQVVKSDGVEWLVYNQSEGKVYFIPRQGGNPIPIGKATIHNDLSGRNAPDCHPESAITGLREHLQELRDKDSEIEEDVQIALNRSQEAKDTADEAKEISVNAQTIAGEAKDIAEDAKETAEGIEGIAQEALDKVTQEITDREDADEDLQDQIDSLSGRGRFLALWNCATGLAESNPPESPYAYKAGDYFVVGTVSSADPAVNYKPDGSSYTTGVASTTVETNEVSVNDTYFYDGTVWKLQSNAQKEVSFSALAGSPYDNTSLSNALNAKQNVFQVETLPTPSVSEDGKIYEYVGETIRTKHEFVTGQQGERTGTLSGYVSDTSILRTKLASINTELGIDCDRLKFVVVANTSGYYYDVYACEGETETLYQQNTSATSSYGIRIGVVGPSAIGTYIYFDMIFDDEYNYSGNFYKCFKRVVVGEKPSAMYVAITNLDLVNSKIAEANETFGITTAKLKFVLTMTGNNQFTVYAVEGDGTEHLMQADINVSNLSSTFGVQIAQTGNWEVGMYAELEYQYYWNEVLELAHLSDIKLKDLEDGQALIYDASTDKWINGNGGVSATYDATTKTITFA